MRLLVFADMHLHSWSNFGVDPSTGLSKRLIDQQKVTNQIVSTAVQEKVDGVLFLGDIIHSVGNVSTEVLNTAYIFFNAFRQVGIPVYFVPGNHDLSDRKNPKWYNYSCKVFNPDKAPDNIKIIGYHEEIDYQNVKGFDIVAIHKTPIGARVGNYEFEDGFNWKELASQNKFVFCGHIHQRQHLSDNCIIIGSPMHLTFGDFGDRGVYLVDTKTGNLEFRKLNYPEFITVENYAEVKDDGNYYRVLSKGPKANTPIAPDSLPTENVKVQTSPVCLPERIKSNNFFEILKEWLNLQKKPDTHLDLISDVVDEKFELGKKIYDGRLYQVAIKDFASIGNVNYSVENGFTLVLGHNDIFNSNGSGKSSLFDAIYWCLFGKTTKGLLADDVIRNRPTQQKDCEVTLILKSKEGKILQITRTKEEGLQIWEEKDEGILTDVCGKRKLGDAQKLLESILGFDEKLFRTSCYFSQENLLMLTGLGDADRTKMVTDLLGFESYNDLYTKTDKKVDNFELEVSNKEQTISKKRLKIAEENGRLETHKETLNRLISNLETTQTKVSELEVKKKEIEIELANFKTTEIPFRNFDDEETLLLGQKSQLLQDLQKAKEEFATHFTSGRKIENSHIETKTKLSHAIDSLTQLERELDVIRKADEGVHCLKCGSLVSKESKEQYIVSKSEEIEKRKIKKDQISTECSKLEEELKEHKVLSEEYSNKVSKLEIDIKNVETKLNELNKQRRDYEVELHKQENQKVTLENRLQNCVEVLNVQKTQVDGLNIQIKVTNDDIDKLVLSAKNVLISIDEIQHEIGQIKEKIGILEFWKVAFSPKGIRSLLLDKFCNEFNSVVGEYLFEISNGNMVLYLTPTSTIKGGEERNKIGMTIRLDKFDVKYETLSGGEKRRIDCTFLFGLSKYLEVKHNLHPYGLLGIMVLDEVFGFLDKAGEDTLSILLEKESKNKAVFVIDHALNLVSSSNRIWTVEKKDHVSSLEISTTI